MKLIVGLLSLIMLAGCAGDHDVMRSTPRNLGDEVQQELTRRYDDVRFDCGHPTKPAFLCSGIIIRGTTYSEAYHSWDPSPASEESGGVSFSYLRQDANFYVRYNNGYIFTSYDHAVDKLKPAVLCGFPIDGNTNSRPEAGCGQFRNDLRSAPCQSLGVNTAAAWLANFDLVTLSGVCGFDLKQSLGAEATTAFDAMLKAKVVLAPPLDNNYVLNELRLQVWPKGVGAQLPIEAFFYIFGSEKGRKDAQSDQLDFKAVTGISVPVIIVKPSRMADGRASFLYLASDQAVVLP